MSNTFIFKPFLALGWWSEGYNAPGADFTRGLSAWEGFCALPRITLLHHSPQKAV
jgi:hypothetical protein